MPSGPRPAPLINVVKMTVRSTAQASVGENIVYIAAGLFDVPDLGPSDLVSMANAWMTLWGNRFKNVMSSVGGIQSVTLQWLPESGSVIEGVSTEAAIEGTAGGTCLSAQAAIVCSWQAGLYYRGGKPRTYLPFPATNMVNSGSVNTWSPTYTADVVAGGNGLISDFLAYTYSKGGTEYGGFGLGTVSYSKDKEWRTPPVFVPYLSAECGSRIDT